MDDASIRDQIEALVAEEQRLLDESEGQGPDEARHERLQEIKVELDRCWDLLRQREAREEFQLDPDDASVRDAGTVEGYEQ
jgi:predicted nuclease with TOPRIM domain